MIRRTFLFAAFALLLPFAQAGAAESDLVVLPPDYDFKKLCKPTPEPTDGLDLEALRKKKISSIKLSTLVDLMKLYSRGHRDIAPDYDYAISIIDYITKRGITPKTRDAYYEAQFTKYYMTYRGRGYPRDVNGAKAILEKLAAAGLTKAYNRLGDFYLDQRNYNKAVEYHKNAVIDGEVSSYFRLAEIYYRQYVKVSQEQVELATRNAQNVALQRIALGDCAGLSWIGLMYDYMEGLPDSATYALKWHEKAAMTDDPRTKLRLARLIQRGYATEASSEKILPLWMEASELGSHRAMFLLGEHYLLNEEDKKQSAIAWLEKSAEHRNLKAAELLARIYEGRYGIKADVAERRKWLELAAKHQHVKKQTLDKLAQLYETSSDVSAKTLLGLYKRSALLGSARAYIKLGDSYRYGIGQDSSPAKALRYYRLAANNGKTEAMEALADAYRCEIGKPYDEQKIDFWANQIRYFSAGAVIEPIYASIRKNGILSESDLEKLRFLVVTRNSPDAMIALGAYYYKNGDKDEANEWFDKALAVDIQQDKEYKSHYQLGALYYTGDVFPINKTRGLELMQQSANAGNNSAHKALGDIANDKGQYDKAIQYYNDAARLGKISAYTNLYELYEKQDNTAKALENLIKAARHNDVNAMLKLAKGYSKHNWMQPQDNKKSAYWFKQAVAHHPCDPDDIENVAKSYHEGKNGAPKDVAKAELWIKRMMVIAPKTLGDTDDLATLAEIAAQTALGANPEDAEKAYRKIVALAESDNPEALEIMSELSIARLHSESDTNIKETILWLERSAAQGNVDAMMHLANLYISGFYVKESQNDAVEWLTKAKNAGSIIASKRLDIITKR